MYSITFSVIMSTSPIWLTHFAVWVVIPTSIVSPILSKCTP